MKTIIVSNRVWELDGTGGMSAYVKQFSELLRKNNHDVSILSSFGEQRELSHEAHQYYESLNIPLIQMTDPPQNLPIHPEYRQPYRERSEEIANYVRDADIVYFQDWEANAFHLVRERRFINDVYPVCINVLNFPTIWLKYYNQQHLTVPDDLLLNYMESYSVQHSDYVISPSQFLVDWLQGQGWQLPQDNRLRVMGYPFLSSEHTQTIPPLSEFNRIVFFGRLDTGKGFDLFVDTLLSLKLSQEIVFLGMKGVHSYDNTDIVFNILREAGYTVTPMTNLNSSEAQAYLGDHIADTLVVMPSLLDNFPFAVVEASHIRGLNFICSNHGGQPEIIGTETGQLFAPNKVDFKQVLLEWIDRGPRPAEQLGRYPAEEANQRWLDFHEEMIDHAKSRQQHIVALPALPSDKPIVDICIAHYNHADYLPDMLRSLDHQTIKNFNVIIIDDGSTDPRALDVFRAMQKRYPQWTFIEQDNRFVDATRNNAIRLGTAEYIIFFDSDDVAAPNMVERYVEAIRYSGDDCVYAYTYEFKEQIDSTDEKPPSPIPYEVYKPFGAELISGILHNTIGGAVIIIRRAVFEEIGGYTEHYQIMWDDFELLIRLIINGYKYDVLPEALYYHRDLDSSLGHRDDTYLPEMRFLSVYEDALETIGLRGLAQAFRSLYMHQTSSSSYNLHLKDLMEVNEQFEEGHVLSRRYIKNLESQVESLQQQIDEQHHRIHQPSIKDVLQVLYRFLIPMSLRLRLQQIRQ